MKNEGIDALAEGRCAKPPPVSTGYPEGVAEDIAYVLILSRAGGTLASAFPAPIKP